MSYSLSKHKSEPSMKPHNRKLIKNEEPPTTTTTNTTQSPFFAYSPLPLLQTMNATTVKNSFKPHSPFDSSMALTILVLLTALFFMGFFSIYIRRFTDDNSVHNIYRRRSRHHHRGLPPPPTSIVASSRFSSSKGLDPSTVRSLPVFPYGGDAKHPIDCPVCLGELEENDTVKMIPYCKHVFHQVCIDKWLFSHVSCPLCRTTRLFPVEERCLGVVKREVDQGVSEVIERSTEDGGDTCALGMRRTSSGSSLGEQGCLQRELRVFDNV